MAEKVVAVQRGNNGLVSAVKTDKGEVYSLPLAIMAIERGDLVDVQARVENHTGGYYLAGDFRNLPKF